MSSEERMIIDYVLNLPPHQNPYGAVARHMKGLMKPPRLATWATMAQRCAMALTVIMFIQSAHLVYARFKVGAFKFWSFSRLGLYTVDIYSATGSTYLLYAILALPDLIILDLANSGKGNLSGEIVIFGCKYLLVMGNAWFFLWVCACLCATLFCETRRLHPAIRVAMNALLLTALCLPIPIVVYCYTRVDLEYDMAKSILHDVLHKLLSKEATVTPQNYSRMALLETLKPARNIRPHAHNMARLTRNGLVVYLTSLITLNVLYVPLLWYSLARLYARSVSQRQSSIDTEGSAGSEKIASVGLQIRNQFTGIMTHAIMAYTTTFLHIPMIIAQLSYKGDGFLRDKTWTTLTRVGFSLPFAIAGNVILAIYNNHARHQMREFRTRSIYEKETKNVLGAKDLELAVLPKYPMAVFRTQDF